MAANHLTKLYRRHGGICHYCLAPTVRKMDKGGKQFPNTATKEHIVPRSLGGPDVMSNYVLACSKCNNRRAVTLFFCKCDLCTAKIEKFLESKRVIDKMFWGLVGFNKPRIVRDRDGKWRVRQPGSNVRFETWQHAMDYVSITQQTYKGIP